VQSPIRRKIESIVRKSKLLALPLLSVLGGSLIGPVSNIIPCEGIFLKQMWRFTALNILYAIGYAIKWAKHGFSDTSGIGKREIGLLFLSVIFQLGWMLIGIYAFLNTIQAHAYTLTNLHGVFTTVFNLVTCTRQVSLLEIIGTVIVVIASLLIIFDPKAKRVGEEPNI